MCGGGGGTAVGSAGALDGNAGRPQGALSTEERHAPPKLNRSARWQRGRAGAGGRRPSRTGTRSSQALKDDVTATRRAQAKSLRGAPPRRRRGGSGL